MSQLLRLNQLDFPALIKTPKMLVEIYTKASVPRVACHRTHATEKYSNSNHSQTQNSSNSTAKSAFECQVKDFSNGIATSIVVFTQKVRNVGNCKGDTE